MHSTQGIILHREDFRERDERVVFYTKDFGKVSAVAKGLKRIEAKLRGSIDIFDIADIIFVEGAYFSILTGIEASERFSALTSDTFLYRAALSCARMVSSVFEERGPDEDFFHTLRFVFRKLNEWGEAGEENTELYSWLLLKKFQMKVLETQGYEMKGVPSRLAENPLRLVEMLQGVQHKGVRILPAELLSIEEMLADKFAYFFRYKIFPWVPRLSS